MAQIATQNNTYSHADAHPTGRVPFSRYAGPLDKLVSIKVERRSEEIKLFDRFGNRKEKKLNPPFSPLSFFASFAPCSAHRGRNLYRMNENLCVCVGIGESFGNQISSRFHFLVPRQVSWQLW